MAAYESFAAIYDSLMDDVDYDAWTNYYLDLLERAGSRPKKLCDCACGTGSMSVRFARRGIRVTGVDVSGEMLELAQSKARLNGVQVMFVRQDMRLLALPRPVDALVCACDGVNYLTDDASLNAFFGKAHAAIMPGGVLAFDISSACKLEKVLGNNFFGEERDDVAYLWSNRFDSHSATVTMDLTFFVRESDERYRRFNEVHVQKAHDPAHLRALMEANGFSEVACFGDQTFDAPTAEAQRIHFTAKRT